MAVSDKPRKKRSKVVAIPMQTPPVQVVEAEEIQQNPGIRIIEEPKPNWYPIDWDKVQSIDDLKFIISNMGLGCQEDAPNYQGLKKYLSDTPQAI